MPYGECCYTEDIIIDGLLDAEDKEYAPSPGSVILLDSWSLMIQSRRVGLRNDQLKKPHSLMNGSDFINTGERNQDEMGNINQLKYADCLAIQF